MAVRWFLGTNAAQSDAWSSYPAGQAIHLIFDTTGELMVKALIPEREPLQQCTLLCVG